MTTLVKINGEEIPVASAIRIGNLHNSDFLKSTMRNAVVRQHAEKVGISNSDEELQLAADELRYNRGLEKVEAVQQWMRENNQTVASIQEAVDMMLLNNKVRNSFSEEQMQAWYAEHRLELEAVELYSIRVDSEDKANELLSQINDEGADFHTLARQHSQDDATRHLGGFVGNLTRSQMTGVVEAAVFKSNPPAVIGPVKTDKGWNLFKAGPITRPSYEDTKSMIRLRLMEELTNKLLAEAKIEHSILAEPAGEA